MSDKNLIKPSFSSGTNLLERIANKPNFCECARIISRPLNNGQAGWLDSITRGNQLFDNLNLKASHEHITWDQSKDNIGFSGANDNLGIWPFEAKGKVFSEEISDKPYSVIDQNCYDGEEMRKAVTDIGQPEGYRMFGFNCQEYVDKIRAAYNEFFYNKDNNYKNTTIR